MYCESNEAGHLDHFEPLALAPDRTFDWQNLVQACDICDSHHKRDRFRSDAGDRPVDPTAEDPSRHLGFLPSGAIDAKTGRGSWTVELLGLDRQQLAVGRQMRWLSLRLLIPEYASLQASGRPSEARRYANAIQRGPFPSVLRDLVAAADSPAADVFGLSQVRAALVQCPEIRRWAGAAQSNQPIGEGDEEA